MLCLCLAETKVVPTELPSSFSSLSSFEWPFRAYIPALETGNNNSALGVSVELRRWLSGGVFPRSRPRGPEAR
jgi:hypothetical protein